MKKLAAAFTARIRPYRTAVFSVMVGIFAVLLVSVITRSGGQLIETELEQLGMDSMLLGTADREALVLDEEVCRAVCAVGGVQTGTPVMMDTGSCRFGNGSEKEVFLWGINSWGGSIVSLELLHGSLFDPLQVTNAQPVCVVDAQLAREAYGKTDIVGSEISLIIDGIARPFTVVGVAQTGSSLLKSISGGVLPDFVYLPHTTLACFCGKNGYDQIAFRPLAGANTAEISTKVRETVSAFCATGTQAVVLQDLFGQRDAVSRVVDVASAVMTLIACVALLVSGIAVMSAVFGAVRRRRREIGIKKSMGAPMKEILAEFISDALLSTLAALVLGLAVGMAILWPVQYLLGLPEGVDLGLVLFGCTAMLLIALLFSFFPAVQAARMRPIDALREYE